MAKRMIEIDVPDGMEPCDPITYTDQYGEISTTLIQLKKKEPAFIEVRECLYMSKTSNGVKMDIAQKGIDDITAYEERDNFIRWVDKDWRKVYI